MTSVPYNDTYVQGGCGVTQIRSSITTIDKGGCDVTDVLLSSIAMVLCKVDSADIRAATERCTDTK